MWQMCVVKTEHKQLQSTIVIHGREKTAVWCVAAELMMWHFPGLLRRDPAAPSLSLPPSLSAPGPIPTLMSAPCIASPVPRWPALGHNTAHTRWTKPPAPHNDPCHMCLILSDLTAPCMANGAPSPNPGQGEPSQRAVPPTGRHTLRPSLHGRVSHIWVSSAVLVRPLASAPGHWHTQPPSFHITCLFVIALLVSSFAPLKKVTLPPAGDNLLHCKFSR